MGGAEERGGATMSRALPSFGAALIAITVAQVAPVSVGELLANPDRFHGQPVIVSGTMSNLRENGKRRRGVIYTFDLSDGTETIVVIAFAKPLCQSGAATVEGTFEQVKRRVKVSYAFEEITARKVICSSDRTPKMN
jgi:hypothetical protein